MKKLIALAVLASSTVAFSAESDIYDIQYLPTPGTTYGFTTFEMQQVEEKSDAGDEDIDGYVISQTVGHAFTDRFSLQLSMNYADLEADPEGDSKYEFAKGISDPTLTARFRTMDSKYRWDLVGGLTYGLDDKDVSSSGDRDNYQGGHSLFLGTQFGAKAERMQWAVLAQFTHNMEGTIDFNDDDVDFDANNELLVRGDILNKLAEKSYLRSHLSANFAEVVETDDNDQISAPSTTYEIGTEYQHLFSKDLLARAGVDYQMVNENTGVEDSHNAWVFRIGANYQF